jgi:hypothetical protein
MACHGSNSALKGQDWPIHLVIRNGSLVDNSQQCKGITIGEQQQQLHRGSARSADSAHAQLICPQYCSSIKTTYQTCKSLHRALGMAAITDRWPEDEIDATWMLN